MTHLEGVKSISAVRQVVNAPSPLWATALIYSHEAVRGAWAYTVIAGTGAFVAQHVISSLWVDYPAVKFTQLMRTSVATLHAYPRFHKGSVCDTFLAISPFRLFTLEWENTVQLRSFILNKFVVVIFVVIVFMIVFVFVFVVVVVVVV